MSKDLKIEFVKISKKFGGVQALENVTFSINMNEIHSIVGENGAGKSTLLRILGGDIRPTSGDIYLRGRKVYFNEPKDARVHGISVIYQELKLCPNMNALQNAFLGNEKKTLYGLNIVEMQKELLSILESLGVKNINIFAPVKLLSLSVQQILEISRALLHGAEIIVMDEPTSALTLEEASNLLRIIKELKIIGKTIVYVSHRLEEVMNISDNITVLRDGKYIATVKKNEVTKRDLVRLMVGGVRDYEKKRISGKVGNKILEVRNLTKV
ncbi:MAG: sugar ABC transporter ATP-binding protein, partial [Actinobacteria bacterium]|nr:sugar ABC transporter ATP-binding protein [Actinomycetota bacterium]